VALDPESFFPQWNVMRAHAWNGDPDRAVSLAPAILAESGRHIWILGLLGWIHGQSGRLETARAVHDEMEGRARHEFGSPFWLAVAAASAGLGEEAIRRAEDAVTLHDPLVLWSRVTPFWEAIRDHPRYGEVVRPVWGHG
jgi:hypothetical protein